MKLKLFLAILLLPFTAMAVNTNVFDHVVVTRSFTVTNSINSVTRELRQSNGVVSVDWQNGVLQDGTGIGTVNWKLFTLKDSGVNTTVNWNTGALSYPGGTSLDWFSDLLVNTAGKPTLRWHDQTIIGTWTNIGSFVVLTNMTVMGTSFLSNVVVSGSLTGGNVASTVSNNTYAITSTNTFSSPTFFSNIFFNGYLTGNSNTLVPSGSTSVLFAPAPGQTDNRVSIIGRGAANTTDIRLGDFVNGPILLLGTDGAGNTRLNSDAVGTFTINVENQAVFTATELSYVFGDNSSDAATFNGSTWTIAHPAVVNGGVLTWASAGGTLSNNTSFTTLNTSTMSNLVVNGSTSIITTTNNGLTISVMGGAGPLNTVATFTRRTNDINGLTPVINQIHTNINQRLRVNVGVAIPTALTAVSGSVLWTVSGSDTNEMGQVMGSAGFSGVVTNTVIGFVQPNALFVISNNTTTAGAPTLVPKLFNLTWE